MQMLMAFTHQAWSLSPAAPIRGAFNEVLNRRLSYGAAASSRRLGEQKHLAGKQAPPSTGVPNHPILARSMLISQLMEDNVRGSQSRRRRHASAAARGNGAAAFKVQNSAGVSEVMDQLRGDFGG